MRVYVHGSQRQLYGLRMKLLATNEHEAHDVHMIVVQ